MVGKTILHYKILNELGQGGMGIVYKAEDTRLKREVAIKFLPHHISASEEEKERFKIEAQAAAALNHPNIATIHAIEEFEEEIFLVMEYIDGQELKSLIKTNLSQNENSHSSTEFAEEDALLPMDEIVNLATPIAMGLKTAHGKGIIHRDIKSSNIMVTSDGQVKIMDFGLAKMAGEAEITKIGTTIGTAAYMSPEQVRGEDIDVRSDIWSFGVVLYEMLCGTRPFSGDYEQAILYSILNEDPDPVSEKREGVPQPLANIILKCLEKEPANRYCSCSEILLDLETITAKTGTKLNQRVDETEISKPTFKLNFKWAAILSAFIFILISAWFFLPQVWQKLSGSRQQHLLVLPFKNIGDNPGGQAFCDGLMETMASKLTQLEQANRSLWVVPPGEVLRNKIQSASEANQVFGVNLVVSGSLQKIDRKILLTLNLIDTKNLRQINSAVIDVDEAELLSLQKRSIAELTRMLKIELSPAPGVVLYAAETTVPNAYDFYLQGRGYLQRYEKSESLDAAIKLFKSAIEEDSLYALAHASLGEAYWRKYETTKNDLLINSARQQSEIASALNDQLPGVNITLGLIYNGTGKYQSAIEVFKKALKVEPTNSDAYRGLAKAYEAVIKLQQAEQTFKRAIELKPDYWAGYNDLGVFYFRHSRYGEAISQFKQVIRLTPDNQRGYNNLGQYYSMIDEDSRAVSFIEEALAMAPENARIMYHASSVYEQLGDRENAIFWITAALKNGYPFAEIKHQPELQKLVADEKFQAVAQKYQSRS